MTGEKVKITIGEIMDLINHIKSRPLAEGFTHNMLMEDFNQMGFSSYTLLYITKENYIEVDKEQIFLFRIKYGI